MQSNGVQSECVQGNDVQSGGTQRMAVSSLGSSGRDQVGVQGGRTRCGRSCSVRRQLKAAVGHDKHEGAAVQPGACVCKATDHAHAGWGPLMREQSRSGAPEMPPSAAILQEATRVCRPCFCSTRV
jgi:hypothetical protein